MHPNHIISTYPDVKINLSTKRRRHILRTWQHSGECLLMVPKAVHTRGSHSTSTISGRVKAPPTVAKEMLVKIFAAYRTVDVDTPHDYGRPVSRVIVEAQMWGRALAMIQLMARRAPFR
jgi:hypothetical protein